MLDSEGFKYPHKSNMLPDLWKPIHMVRFLTGWPSLSNLNQILITILSDLNLYRSIMFQSHPIVAHMDGILCQTTILFVLVSMAERLVAMEILVGH